MLYDYFGKHSVIETIKDHLTEDPVCLNIYSCRCYIPLRPVFIDKLINFRNLVFPDTGSDVKRRHYKYLDSKFSMLVPFS